MIHKIFTLPDAMNGLIIRCIGWIVIITLGVVHKQRWQVFGCFWPCVIFLPYKIDIFWLTYPPSLVNVVCEPWISFAMSSLTYLLKRNNFECVQFILNALDLTDYSTLQLLASKFSDPPSLGHYCLLTIYHFVKWFLSI